MVEVELGDDLPNDWESRPLGELIAPTKATINPQRHPDESFDYFSIPAYQERRTPSVELGRRILSQKLLVEPGTVLFGKLNPRVPKVWLVTGDSSRRKLASTEFIPLVPRSDIDAGFLFYLAASHLVLGRAQELTGGSTPSRQRVDVGAFKRLPVPVPPMREQRAIAHVLSTVEKAREQADQVITAAQELKRSLMRHLFAFGHVSPASSSDSDVCATDVGPLPAGWSLSTLGELFDIQQGKAMSPAARRGLRPREFLRTANVYWGHFDLTAIDAMDFTEQEERKFLIRAGDLLVCEGGAYAGRTAVWFGDSDRYCYQNHLHRCRLKTDGAIAEFIRYWMELAFTQRGTYAGSANTSAIPNISKARLAAYKVPLPPVPVQRDIVSSLRAVERKLSAERARRDALQALFSSLLEGLFVARLRINGLVAETVR